MEKKARQTKDVKNFTPELQMTLSGKPTGEPYPPKVAAMFEAVLELLASGRELSSLKVSEITEKAGIGKGTAYEYFSTKEEIIAGAIEYEAARHFSIILGFMEAGQTFEEIIYSGLDMLEAANEKYNGFVVMEKILRDSTIGESTLIQELVKNNDQCGLGFHITERLMELAKDSGVIQETNPWKVWGAILSQFIIYAFYLTHRGMLESMKREEAREFVYQNILKILNKTP